MIKIDVYDNPESAREVFKAYYNMICGCVSFSNDDIADAISIQFRKEYQEELGLDKKTNVKVKDCSNLLKSRYRKLYDFLYLDEELQKENLGVLLCGYMDDGQLIELRENYDFFDDKCKELEDIFRYESMSNKQEFIYKFVQSMNVQVCPYCNRNYISVVVDKSAGFKTRSELDHFFNKSKYPYLAVSMRNLVPSCHVCNLSKHAEDKNILYPYKEGLGNNYIFAIDTSHDISYFTNPFSTEFNIVLKKNKFAKDNTDNEFDTKVMNSSRLFGWNSLYEFSKKYAARVFQNGYILNISYKESLCNAFPGFFRGIEDVERVINPKLRPEDEYNQEPLSKLTRDIYESTKSI